MTPALMRTDMYAVIRSANKDFFAKREHVIVAVNEGNPNYNAFLQDNYPDWRVVYYPDTAECLKVVSEGRAGGNLATASCALLLMKSGPLRRKTAGSRDAPVRTASTSTAGTGKISRLYLTVCRPGWTALCRAPASGCAWA